MTTHSFFPAWATPAIELMVRNEVFIFECDATRSIARTLPTKYQLIINLKTANALGPYVLGSLWAELHYVLSPLCTGSTVSSVYLKELALPDQNWLRFGICDRNGFPMLTIFSVV